MSKELNHLAAILHYYAGSFIWVFVGQSQLEYANLKLLHFLFMVNYFCVQTLKHTTSGSWHWLVQELHKM